jgi:hypothetical protein
VYTISFSTEISTLEQGVIAISLLINGIPHFSKLVIFDTQLGSGENIILSRTNQLMLNKVILYNIL